MAGTADRLAKDDEEIDEVACARLLSVCEAKGHDVRVYLISTGAGFCPAAMLTPGVCGFTPPSGPPTSLRLRAPAGHLHDAPSRPRRGPAVEEQDDAVRRGWSPPSVHGTVVEDRASPPPPRQRPRPRAACRRRPPAPSTANARAAAVHRRRVRLDLGPGAERAVVGVAEGTPAGAAAPHPKPRGDRRPLAKLGFIALGRRTTASPSARRGATRRPRSRSPRPAAAPRHARRIRRPARRWRPHPRTASASGRKPAAPRPWRRPFQPLSRAARTARAPTRAEPSRRSAPLLTMSAARGIRCDRSTAQGLHKSAKIAAEAEREAAVCPDQMQLS